MEWSLNELISQGFLKLFSTAAAGLGSRVIGTPGAFGQAAAMVSGGESTIFNVKSFGAKADGLTIDSAGINRAAEAVSRAGGGTIHFPAGTYACYSIHFKSNVALYLDQGATIVAVTPPATGRSGGAGYDSPEPKTAWDQYRKRSVWAVPIEGVRVMYPHSVMWVHS